MKKPILLLTDITNDEDEDIMLAQYLLKKGFNVVISPLAGISSIEKDFSLIIIRDTYPFSKLDIPKYNEDKRKFLIRAKKEKLKVYNDLNACADRGEKEYLVDLYNKDYPVIPSIDDVRNINRLPKVKEYIAKPKDGLDSVGMKYFTYEELKKFKSKDYIIQPKLNFKYEISFYFVDDEFLYCLIFKPSKIPEWPNPKVFKPSRKDLAFARKFVKWNKMKSGIQRVDAIRLASGGLLLMELEDDSPYFSLPEIGEKLRNKFLKEFAKSVVKYIGKK